MKLRNRVAIVTGGARGIGKAIALTFVREGAKVALVDVDQKQLETLKNEIDGRKGESINIPCDIAEASEVQSMVNQVHKAFGRIDILVNNAGIIRRGTIETVSEEDWDRVIEVNLKGTFNCCKAVVGIMKKQSYGKIVNVSSIAGKLGDITSAPGYGPSKAGVDALTKTNETLVKISNETDSLLAEIDKLQKALADAIAAGNQITPELQAAIAAVDTRANSIDQLVPDVPQPEGKR